MKTIRSTRRMAREVMPAGPGGSLVDPAPASSAAVAGLGVVRQAGGWPYRWWMPPLAASAVIWVAAVAARARFGLGAPLLILLAAEVIAGLWGWRRLRARADRCWLASAGLAIAGWLPVAVLTAPWRPMVLVVWAAGTLVFSLRWGRHPWTRSRVQVDRDVAAWPQQAGTLGVPGATLQALQVTPTGRQFVIDLVEGQTWRAIRAETAESVLGTAPGAVSVERDLSSARRVILHVRDRDPWTGDGVPHPVLAAIAASSVLQQDPTSTGARRLLRDRATTTALSRWRPGSGTVADPIEIGVRPDGTAAALPIWRTDNGALHWLVGGQTGAGKTVFYRDLIAGLTRCADVEIWGIDTGKHGKAFTPWAPVMSRIATTLAEAVELLTDADALVATSARSSAAQAAEGVGTDNVQPTPETPLVVILVDEAADLLDTTKVDIRSEDARRRQQAVGLLEGITAKARSEAVSVVLCTQRPDNASLGGSSVLRSHATIGVCLRMRNPSDIKWVLSGADAAELDVSLFRHPGLLYAQIGADTLPVPIRDYALLTPADARRVADYLAPGMTRTRREADISAKENTMPTEPAQPDPTDRTATDQRPFRSTVASGVLGRIRGYLAETEADQPSTAPAIPLAALATLHESAEVAEPGDEGARTAILGVLAGAGTDGASRTAICEATDLLDATVQRLLAAAERAGLVVGGSGTGPGVIWRRTGTGEGQ